MIKNKTAKILIIDDDPGIVDSLQCCLEISNFEVITACDGTQGIEIFKSEKPDLIILDISLPDKNGYAFIKELRAEKNSLHTPIIVTSGHNAPKHLSGTKGVAAYFVKPFDPEKLIAKIHENIA